jgi:hypothetical protein
VPETLHTRSLPVLAAEAANQLTLLVLLLKPVTENKNKTLDKHDLVKSNYYQT